MTRPIRFLALAGLLGWSCLGSPAVAQYNYPAGYGGYGWHGWGGGSTAGRQAAGLGVFAAGAGQGAANLGAGQEMNAQARSMNAQTAMGVNNYLYECNLRNVQNYWARRQQDQSANIQAQAQIHDRILNHPTEDDVNNGDALNAIFVEITNPQIYGMTLDLAQTPLRSAEVKRIPFTYAPGGFTYSLKDLTSRQEVPAVYNGAAFADDRKTLRALAAQLHEQTLTKSDPDPATTQKFRATLDHVKATLEAMPGLDSNQKFEAEKYLKALYGLTKMLDSPAYDVYLASVDAVPSVPLCEVLSFMHAFNLKFGVTTTPAQKEYYAQLYGTLATLRRQVNAPPGQNFVSSPPSPGNDSRAANFFGGMSYSTLTSPSKPPAPPAAGLVP